MKLFAVSKSFLLATLLVVLSTCTVHAKISGFLNPFEPVGQSTSHREQQQHAQDMKKTLHKRRLDAARREIAIQRGPEQSGGQTTNIGTIQATTEKASIHRALSSKKSSASMMSKSGKGDTKSGKGSASKSKGSKKSSKSGKGSKKMKSAKRSSSSKGGMMVKTATHAHQILTVQSPASPRYRGRGLGVAGHPRR